MCRINQCIANFCKIAAALIRHRFYDVLQFEKYRANFRIEFLSFRIWRKSTTQIFLLFHETSSKSSKIMMNKNNEFGIEIGENRQTFSKVIKILIERNIKIKIASLLHREYFVKNININSHISGRKKKINSILVVSRIEKGT